MGNKTTPANGVRLVYNAALKEVVAGAKLVVDASFLIDLSNVVELRRLYEELQSQGCVFTSILPVATEFLYAADNMQERVRLREFLKDCLSGKNLLVLIIIRKSIILEFML